MELNTKSSAAASHPVKVLQFGEGNFLRAFVDWMIQKANNTLNLDMGVVIVQPLAHGMIEALKKQNCNYHVVLEGIKNAKPIREIKKVESVLDAVNPYRNYQIHKQYFLNPALEFVISNTTEAGISRVENDDINAEPPVSFPGKITQLLYQRYRTFNGAPDKGLTFIACELIENNASTLKEIVLELAQANKLEADFIAWINEACTFCNSLVDRIVTGFPKDNIAAIQKEIGVDDNMVVTAEYYHLWAIEGNAETKAKFPLHKAGLNVLWLDSLKTFRDKKVRVLNGAHTALVPVSLLAGHKTVKEAFADKYIETFIRKLISDEVLPNIDGNIEELKQFADEILERFLNPYIKHFLKDISLNSISKWVTRDYPSLKDSFNRTGKIPERLSFSLAALLTLYSLNNTIDFEPNDTPERLDFIRGMHEAELPLSEKVKNVLSNKLMWGINLDTIAGLSNLVTEQMQQIKSEGIYACLKQLNN